MSKTIFAHPEMIDRLLSDVMRDTIARIDAAVEHATLFGIPVLASPHVPATRKVMKHYPDWRERMDHNFNLPVKRLRHTLPLEYEVEEPVFFVVDQLELPKIVYRKPVFEW
jgi:hypothetical protein